MTDTIQSLSCEVAPGERGHFMRTFTGRKFWPMDPKAEDMSIVDVAHHLAMQVRFNGATKDFYSVAEHCVIGSYLVPDEYAFEFLMHDAPEAWLGDMIRPIKNHTLCGDQYKLIELGVDSVVRAKWGMAEEPPSCVKRMDSALCAMEIDQVYGAPVDYVLRGEGLDFSMLKGAGYKLHFWDWRTAEIQFFQRFLELTVNTKHEVQA